MADGKATVRDYSTFGARRLVEAVSAHCDSLDDVGAFPNASACARELVNRVAKHLDAIGNTTDFAPEAPGQQSQASRGNQPRPKGRSF